MFRSQHLPGTKNSHSQNFLTVVSCLFALVLGHGNAYQSVTTSEQERGWNFTNSSSFGSNIERDLSSEGHYTSLDETIHSANKYNLEEFQTTDRNSIEASDEGEIWAKNAFNSAIEVMAFSLNVQTKEPETTQHLETVQHMTLAPDVPGYKVFAGSGNASQSSSYERSKSVLHHSAADIVWENEHPNNDFMQREGQSTEPMTNNANVTLLNILESMEYQNEHKKNYSIQKIESSEHEYGLEDNKETDTIMKKWNKILFNASKNKNATFIDGNNKSDSFSQNMQETVLNIYVNTTTKREEKLSEITHNQVTAWNKDKTEIERKVVFTRENTDTFSEVADKVKPGSSSAETVFEILKTSQINTTSRKQHAELMRFLSKFGIGSGGKNVSTVTHAQYNKYVNISNKLSYSDIKLHSKNIDVQNHSNLINKSRNVPVDLEISTDLETSNVRLRHGPVFTSPEINKLRSSNCSEDHSSCKEPCSSTTNSSCSCQWACTIQGTCCEDIAQCPSVGNEDSKMLDQIQSSTIQCRDGYILVSSCHLAFNSNLWEEMKTRTKQATEHDESHDLSWWLQYVDEDMSDTQLRQRCESSDLTSDLINKLPVTDTATQIHFKNVFCAICHNISQVHFWVTLAICDSQSSNSRPYVAPEPARSRGVTSRYLRIFSEDCQTTWLPEDEGHLCVSNPGDILGLTSQTLKEATTGPSVTDGLLTGRSEDIVLPEWRRERSLVSADGSQEEALSTEKFTSIPDYGSSGSFKQPECTKSISRLPANKSAWYTVRHIPAEPGPLAIPEWDATLGIEERHLAQIVNLVEGESRERNLMTNQQPSGISKGECDLRSFQLLISATFSFERTGLMTGDFTMEVQRHTQLLMKVFESSSSNTIGCTSDASNYIEITNHVFGKQVKMDCSINPLNTGRQSGSEDNKMDTEDKTNDENKTNNEDMSINDNKTNTEDKTNNENKKNTEIKTNDEDMANNDNTTNKENKSDVENGLKTCLQFINDRFDLLERLQGAMGLPATVDYQMCLYSAYVDDTTEQLKCRHCTKTTITWEIQRSVDAIFGRISLEALVSIICCLLSIIGLISRLVLQRLVPFFNSYPGKVQFCLCVSLLIAYAFFLVGGSVDDGTRPCRIVAIITHLAFLSSLLWMNVTAFEIWRTFRHWSNQVMTRGLKNLILSTIYSVGIPTMIVTAALILEELWPWSDYAPYYGRPSCWLNGSKAVAIFFVAPCSFVSFINVIFVGLTLRGLRRQRTSISEFRKSKNNMVLTDTSIVVKIIFLVGITWLFGLLAALIDNKILWIIFTILNASLGFFISLVLVFNRRVMMVLWKRWLSYRADSTLTSLGSSVPKAPLKA